MVLTHSKSLRNYQATLGRTFGKQEKCRNFYVFVITLMISRFALLRNYWITISTKECFREISGVYNDKIRNLNKSTTIHYNQSEFYILVEAFVWI